MDRASVAREVLRRLGKDDDHETPVLRTPNDGMGPMTPPPDKFLRDEPPSMLERLLLPPDFKTPRLLKRR